MQWHVCRARARHGGGGQLERAHRELSKTVRHACWVQGVPPRSGGRTVTRGARRAFNLQTRFLRRGKGVNSKSIFRWVPASRTRIRAHVRSLAVYGAGRERAPCVSVVRPSAAYNPPGLGAGSGARGAPLTRAERESTASSNGGPQTRILSLSRSVTLAPRRNSTPRAHVSFSCRAPLDSSARP